MPETVIFAGTEANPPIPQNAPDDLLIEWAWGSVESARAAMARAVQALQSENIGLVLGIRYDLERVLSATASAYILAVEANRRNVQNRDWVNILFESLTILRQIPQVFALAVAFAWKHGHGEGFAEGFAEGLEAQRELDTGLGELYDTMVKGLKIGGAGLAIFGVLAGAAFLIGLARR